MNINTVRFHGCLILLDFAGQLDGTSDVPSVQVELWVEVLVGRDGCGVVRTGALGHVALTETQTGGVISDGVHQKKLQVVWVDVILWRLLTPL